MAYNWKKTAGGINYVLGERVVRVETTPELVEALRAAGHPALDLAEELRALYAAQFGRPLDITAASLACEIDLHARLNVFFRRGLKRSGRLPGKPLAGFLGKMMAHTDVIDCGERAIDNNRFVFDMLAFLYGGR